MLLLPTRTLHQGITREEGRLNQANQQLLPLQLRMKLSSQIQKRSNSKAAHQSSSHYRREVRGKENTLSALSTDPCIPSTESNEDYSQDMLRQVTLKNQLLTAQLSEYKLMVQQLEKRIRELKQENTQLKKREQVMSKAAAIIYEQPKTNELNSTVPLAQTMYPSFNNDSIVSLSQISEILNRFRPTPKIQLCSKQVLLKQLVQFAEEREEMELFVDRVWQMKDRIEPGGQMLWELWEWLKTVGSNYGDLRRYQAKNYGLSRSVKQS